LAKQLCDRRGHAAHGDDLMEVISLVYRQSAERGFAEAQSFIERRVEHWPEIAGRGIDDLQDLRGRGLLFQRFAKVAVSRVQLAKQPDVLDGDCRLFGEGFDQLDLGGREGLDLPPAAADDPDRPTLAKDRYSEKRAVLRHRLEQFDRARVVVELAQHALRMRRPRVDKSSAHREVPRGRSREQAVKCRRLLRRHAVDRHQV
jgi:hypothetical protein